MITKQIEKLFERGEKKGRKRKKEEKEEKRSRGRKSYISKENK